MAFCSPWGFENVVSFSINSYAFLFIILTKLDVYRLVFYFVRSIIFIFFISYGSILERYPMIYESKWAASLPDGSITPYNKSFALTQVFALS
jgi:hypothetical protein